MIHHVKNWFAKVIRIYSQLGWFLFVNAHAVYAARELLIVCNHTRRDSTTKYPSSSSRRDRCIIPVRNARSSSVEQPVIKWSGLDALARRSSSVRIRNLSVAMRENRSRRCCRFLWMPRSHAHVDLHPSPGRSLRLILFRWERWENLSSDGNML